MRRLILEHLIDVKPDGSFRLNQEYFDYCTGLTMTNARFDALFGGPPRKPEELVRQRDMDLAASIQAVTEEVMLRLTAALADGDRAKNLCLAGGVALNCVANGKILRDGKFERIWIQPAAGDAGGALGAALAAYHLFKDRPRKLDGAARRHAAAPISARPSTRTRSSGACALPARCSTSSPDHDDDRGHRRRAGRRQGGRLVPGPHGVRAARARRPLDPRRRALADHAEDAQPQGQVPRIVPAVRALGAARGGRRLVRARRRQPVHAAGRRRRAGAPPADERGRARPVRHRQAERRALARSRP